MSRTCIHLVVFVLVVKLCVCTNTSVLNITTDINVTRDISEKTTAHTDPPSSSPSTINTTTHNSSHELAEQTPDNSRNFTGSSASESTIKGFITTAYTTVRSNTTKLTTRKPTTTELATMQSTGGYSNSKSAGIFFLILIIIIIIILATVLYILWKKGKRYSFDLTVSEHETPLQTIENMGVFEPTKGSTTNLDYIQEDKPNPVANGCTGETLDSTPSSEQQNVPQEDSYSSDLSLSSPVKRVEFNLDLELIGVESDLVRQATDNETTDNDNENNNNDMSTGNDAADFFTEINLDDAQ
ncbi:uncharacterized protein LOC124398935 [Silurus meridionalis]|uniref:Uncharacterized protein n=1 Tax=Silurus meridionalis TaxID=175797 RepID=A0A8T0AVX1_SILME|nr:uncharacterized protein LOC124398935 [Silurus meridionalis]KAF7696318.1 hypothetical protein HF521_006412 [Silurus meridionalis]